MANSNPENAIINAKGINPKKKNNIPLVIILYVNPLNIDKSMWPDKIFAASLNPNDTFLDKYEMNSINTNNGNNAKGHPEGTNNEKNFNPCLWNPKNVAPKTTVKLSENVKIKCDVDAKLYGTIPIKLFTKININNAYIKGKYSCPFVGLSWFITILCTVAYILSWLIDQLFGIILLLFVANKLYVNIKNIPIDKYKPIFVNDKCMFPNKLAFKENKSLTSNWSKGLKIKSKCNIFYCFFFFLYSIDGF